MVPQQGGRWQIQGVKGLLLLLLCLVTIGVSWTVIVMRMRMVSMVSNSRKQNSQMSCLHLGKMLSICSNRQLEQWVAPSSSTSQSHWGLHHLNLELLMGYHKKRDRSQV
jgi:hypothetical protein